jgi:1,2-diacylglycerol 3-alpha-glucosyltransferase
MKILISTDTYYPHVNGASYFAQRLAHYLHRAGNDVRVLAPSQSFSFTDTIIDGIRVYGMRSYPILFYKGFRFAFPILMDGVVNRIMDDFDPDIVHLQGHFFISRAALRAAKDRHIPVVATNHFMPENILHYLHFPFIEAAVKRAAWWDFSRVFRKADRVTTPTRTAAEFIQQYLPFPVEPISCGIDLDRFSSKNDGAYLKEKYHLPDRPILLYVGRLDKEKNVDLVLRAFARIAADVNVQFVVAGSGAERSHLLEEVAALKIGEWVTFTGFVPNDDLPGLYAIADCFIIAGTAELQSIVTMEAMASGLPVIAVDACALPELVKDEENGFLFKPGDADGLSEEIRKMFTHDDIRASMGKKSVEMIARHDIKKTIAAFERLYQEEDR